MLRLLLAIFWPSLIVAIVVEPWCVCLHTTVELNIFTSICVQLFLISVFCRQITIVNGLRIICHTSINTSVGTFVQWEQADLFSVQESEFLKNALMVPWTLSTSQQPQQQIQGSPDCSNLQFKNKVHWLPCWCYCVFDHRMHLTASTSLATVGETNMWGKCYNDLVIIMKWL